MVFWHAAGDMESAVDEDTGAHTDDQPAAVAAAHVEVAVDGIPAADADN